MNGRPREKHLVKTGIPHRNNRGSLLVMGFPGVPVRLCAEETAANGGTVGTVLEGPARKYIRCSRLCFSRWCGPGAVRHGVFLCQKVMRDAPGRVVGSLHGGGCSTRKRATASWKLTSIGRFERVFTSGRNVSPTHTYIHTFGCTGNYVLVGTVCT